MTAEPGTHVRLTIGRSVEPAAGVLASAYRDLVIPRLALVEGFVSTALAVDVGEPTRWASIATWRDAAAADAYAGAQRSTALADLGGAISETEARFLLRVVASSSPSR